MKYVFALLALLAAQPALACSISENWEAEQEKEFAEYDSNSDGKLSYEEYKSFKKESGAPTYAIKSSWDNLSSISSNKEYLTKRQYITSRMPKCASEAIEEQPETNETAE